MLFVCELGHIMSYSHPRPSHILREASANTENGVKYYYYYYYFWFAQWWDVFLYIGKLVNQKQLLRQVLKLKVVAQHGAASQD